VLCSKKNHVILKITKKIDFINEICYNPDFYSKPTKKRPQSLDTSEIAAFVVCPA
jgi:hypothetical protein